MKHAIEWHTAAPLWDHSLEDSGLLRTRFKAPALLRFANDAFMEELQRVLAHEPERLADYVAQQESWRDEGAGWLAEDDIAFSQPIKLYQPVHNRFYLVATSLNCRIPGLPEQRVEAAAEEKVSFVIRRLIDGKEYGWLRDQNQGAWQSLTSELSVADEEERIGLFPVAFQMEGHTRRLYAGLIPVASREVYESGAMQFAPRPTADELSTDPLGDPRIAEFRSRTLVGLQSLADLPDDVSDNQAQEILAFALLDLAEFLQSWLQNVWHALDNSDTELSSTEDTLYKELTAEPGFDATTSWRDLLIDIHKHRRALLTRDFNDLGITLMLSGLSASDIKRTASRQVTPVHPEANPKLYVLVKAALPSIGSTVSLNSAGASATTEENPEASYVIRCVYERPRCKGFVAPIVSRPSRPFQLASFFDPDAPIRPVHIRMPIDTSLKGLRKFPKGVSFELSKQLRRQIERAQSVGLDGLLEGKSGSSSVNLGMICSFSIPIITICALILLMIIVQLLNIIFWWLPFFRICLPVKR